MRLTCHHDTAFVMHVIPQEVLPIMLPAGHNLYSCPESVSDDVFPTKKAKIQPGSDTALYVCLACAARVLGARYQRREAMESVHTTKLPDADTTAAIPIPVALAGVVTGVVPEREPIFGSMLVASQGQMATDSAPRRSKRVMTQQPTRLLDIVELYVVPKALLRNVACERKAVTAEMQAIGLRPDGEQMLLKRVSASRALRLLKQFRQGYCPMIRQKFSICDPVSHILRTKVRIEVHQPIVNLPWLQVVQQGTITTDGVLGCEPTGRGRDETPGGSEESR